MSRCLTYATPLQGPHVAHTGLGTQVNGFPRMMRGMLPLHRMPCERPLDEDGGKKEGEKAAKNSAEMGSVYLVTE